MSETTRTAPSDPDGMRTAAMPIDASTDSTPLSIPGYEVLASLGEGGMGVVWKARQSGLNRFVALKMVLGGHQAKPNELIRFLAEAEAVAAVKHPNVVQVYEFGDANGRPFLAMEYLDGGSLTDRLKTQPAFTPTAAAQLIEKLARAVQAAHDQQIVHRDLKPGNVLFDTAGEPKVTDFGLAKRAGGSDLTRTQAIMGTPAYMAPEQAKGESKFVGPAADVWALGVILYECLTGSRPFSGDGALDIMQNVMDSEPERPQKRSPNVPRDVELICLKCLEKNPAERYASAKELAEDLRKFQSGEAVSVHSAGFVEQAAKWARRKPLKAAAWGLGSAAVMLLAFGIIVLALWRQAAQDRDSANVAKQVALEAREGEKTERKKAESAQNAAEAAQQRAEQSEQDVILEREKIARSEYGRTMQVAHQVWRDNNVAATLALLDSTRPDLRGWEWHYVHRLCHSDVFTLQVKNYGRSQSFNADESRVVAGTDDNTAKVWDTKTEAEVLILKGHTHIVTSASFSADESRVVTGSVDKTAKVWDTKTGAEALTLKGHTNIVNSASLSKDGSRVVTGSDDKTAKVWDAKTGAELLTLKGHTDSVTSASFSADGSRLVTGSDDKTAKVWDAKTGAEVLTLKGHTGGVYSASFSADGLRLVTGSHDKTAKIWDSRPINRDFLPKEPAPPPRPRP